MGITLQAQENLTVVRQLSDHTDASTYYVQAVVRNSRTDAILATLNLTDKGFNRFTKEYGVPADPSGMGLYIDITTTVYSDEEMSTKASNYGEENEQYLVLNNRSSSSGGGSSGGGSDVDYKKIKKMIDAASEEVKKAVAGIEIPKQDKEAFKAITTRLDGISSQIEGIEMPESKEPDFQKLNTTLESMKNSILEAVENMDHSPDLEPITRAFNQLEDILIDKIKSGKAFQESVQKDVVEKMDRLEKAINTTPKLEELKDFNLEMNDMLHNLKALRVQLFLDRKDNPNEGMEVSPEDSKRKFINDKVSKLLGK